MTEPVIDHNRRVPAFASMHSLATCGGRFFWAGLNVVQCRRCGCRINTPSGDCPSFYVDYDPQHARGLDAPNTM